MNVTQCRMARAALKWSLNDMAQNACVGRATIARFEGGGSIRSEMVEALRQCFVAQGVEFINGGKSVGVRVPRQD